MKRLALVPAVVAAMVLALPSAPAQAASSCGSPGGSGRLGWPPPRFGHRAV